MASLGRVVLGLVRQLRGDQTPFSFLPAQAEVCRGPETELQEARATLFPLALALLTTVGSPLLCVMEWPQDGPRVWDTGGHAVLQQAHLAHYFSQHVPVAISSFDGTHSERLWESVKKKC